MERVTVSSSNIASVGYDSASETLEIEFKNGLIYHYFNVPEIMHEQLMAASSLGSFFNANIRNVYGWQRA
jgi:KTSC domain